MRILSHRHNLSCRRMTVSLPMLLSGLLLAPDEGTFQKVCCLAPMQTVKDAGEISVGAASPSLDSALLTVRTDQKSLQTQVPVWDLPVPKGGDITCLWRPHPEGPVLGLLAWLIRSNIVAAVRQDGGRITFRAVGSTYERKLGHSHLELQRSINLPLEKRGSPGRTRTCLRLSGEKNNNSTSAVTIPI